jgi:hypothetical protein
MSPKYDGGAVPTASPTRLPDRPTERIRNVAATSNFRPRRTAEGVARATREKSSHDASARAEAASESQQDSAADVHTGAVAVAQTPAGSEVAERKMLRIELQTADPNVRIIWFSPQTNDGPPRR